MELARMRFFSLIFFLFTTKIFAQGDIIKDSVKVEGVYLTFDEFRKNDPSLPGKVLVSDNLIKYFDTVDREFKNVKKSYWGACLNDTVYVYIAQATLSAAPRIYPVQSIDRYCFVSGFSSTHVGSGIVVKNASGTSGSNLRKNTSGILRGSGSNIPMAVTRKAEFVININNGNTYLLSDNLIKTIMNDDPELLRLYEGEEDRKNSFKKYILEYNNGHQDEIKPIR